MKKVSSIQSGNTFKTMVRSVVKEELTTVEKRLDDKWNWRFTQLEERFDSLEDKFSKFRDEIMTGIDQITGMFKNTMRNIKFLAANTKD